ncbi:serine hydrolase [Alisedimentitalea sp. MJ-SS2]|uniref:serine hydrolase domain-containing protein n=1 Tax=Aliisedimentitalea sp. MJ-SS2 TaxID=3049795 RepID=UPI002907B07E|nr:serine hydrolase [Alisedimentitalea sp. MJ-SS2]MDU8926022.1 serine hydrolase [Alisedimentitalea sp. MJ-SS2]
MRRFGKFLGRLLLILIILGVVLWVWKREQITRLMAVNSLFSEELIVDNFSNMNRMFLTLPMTRGPGPVSPLPQGPDITLPEGADQWIKDRAVTALIVMKNGQLRHESYYLGTAPEDRRISWSVAKSFLSALFGVVLSEGAIASINDPVTKYAASLKGTAYDTATIQDVLQMESGITFNEDYLDFWSDINKMGRVIALGTSMDGFTEALTDADAPPGERMQYVSIDTHVIGMVIRGATGRRIADLMQEKILDPMGFEEDPYYISDGYETAFVLGGLNLRTRDYARFGQMVMQNGMWQGKQVVPADWLAVSTVPSAKTAQGKRNYGYQWWMAPEPREGEFYARGIYGQYIYFDRTRGVVIAANGADRGFREPGAHDSNIAMFRRITEGLE